MRQDSAGASSQKQAADLAGKTLEERLEILGFLKISNAGADVLDEAVKKWAKDYWTIPEASTKDIYRDAVYKALKGVVSAPNRLIKGAIDDARPEVKTPVLSGSTAPARVIDLLSHEGDKSYLISTPKGPEVREDIGEDNGWTLPKLRDIWEPPEQDRVTAYLNQTVDPAELWGDMVEWFKSKVVLPDPVDEWASLLTAWTLGSHKHRRFNYFPLLYLPGEPERGKTRLGKAIAFLSYRGCYTPSITPAVFFRRREWHSITLLLDVGDVTNLLQTGDMLDLVLNSFERDGIVSRAQNPDRSPWDQVESYRVYGPTILLTNQHLRRTHNNVRSRCIEVVLPEAGHIKVPDAVRTEDVETKDLLARITAWSAGTHNSVLEEVDPPFRGRLADIGRPLLQMAHLANPGAVAPIIEVLSKQDRARRADNADSWEARVAVSLWKCRDRVKENRLFISELTDSVNEGRPENEQLTKVTVGNIRKNLGLGKGKGGSTGTTYVQWPGNEEVKALYDRYSQKGYPEPPDSPETVGTQGESEQDTSQDTQKSLQKTSSTESPQNTTTTGGAGHTGDTATYMSRQDVPGAAADTTPSDSRQMDLPMTSTEEDDPIDGIEQGSMQDEAYR